MHIRNGPDLEGDGMSSSPRGIHTMQMSTAADEHSSPLDRREAIATNPP
jgi:hypothetical protein